MVGNYWSEMFLRRLPDFAHCHFFFSISNSERFLIRVVNLGSPLRGGDGIEQVTHSPSSHLLFMFTCAYISAKDPRSNLDNRLHNVMILNKFKFLISMC